MLLTSWVRNFRQSLRTRRRAHRTGSIQSQAWHANARRSAATRTERLEERTLLTALVIDQQFVDSSPGVISIDNSTIDVNSDGTPEFDSIVIDTVTFDGAGGRGISINLSDISINRISIDELNITGTQGSGVDITLDNVDLNSLVIEKSNIASSVGGGIGLNLTDVVVPTIAVYQSSILVTNGTGLDINIASQNRNARTEEIDIAESTIDGVSITAAGLEKSILTGTGADPVAITSVDHGLLDGTEVTITGVQGLTAANTVDTVTVVDENVFTLDNANGLGQTYQGGGTITVFTTVNDIRVTDNTIGQSAGATGLDIDLSNARSRGLTVAGNTSIRSIGITLDESPIDGLVIRDTTIDATRPQVDALEFDLTDSTLTNLLIDGNTIQGNGVSGGGGVVFTAADSNVYGTFTNNTVDDTLGNGLSFAATASAAFLAENRGPLAFDFNSFAADTALTADLSKASTTLQVADGRSFQAQQVIQIGNEQMFVSAVNGDTLTVVRGERGTLPVAHTSGSIVRSVTGAASGVARSISGNTFSNNDGAGFFTDLDAGTSVAADIRGNTFLANQLRAIDVTVKETNAVTTQVSREGISRTASILEVNDASVFSGFLFPFNVMVEGEEMTVTSIDGNDLNVTRGVNGTAARFHSANSDVIATQGDGLRLDIGGEAAADRNAMTFNRNGGIRITLQDDAAGSFDIQNNQITSVEGTDADGISVNLTSVNTQTEARNILRRSSIRDNLIGTSSFTSLTANLSAGLTVFTVADASEFTTGQDVRIGGEEITINTIVGNTLTVTRGVNGTTASTHLANDVVMAIDGGNTDRGIDFFIQESSALEDILIDNNVIANNGDDGIRFQRFDEGITRTVNPRDGQTRAVTISNNTVSGNARNPEVDFDIDDDGSLEAYGAGIEIHVFNGTLDSFDASIADNSVYAHVVDGGVGLPLGSQVNGLNFRAEADAQIIADVVRNNIQFNQDDGVHTSDRSNSGTDLRDISLSLFSNTISDNLDDGLDFTSVVGQAQVLVIGREGNDSQGLSFGNEISRNGNIGIRFGPGAGSARAAITNNLINENGQVISTAIGTNNGAGSVVNGSGIQIQTGANIAIKANTFESNNGAGVDINNGGNYSVRNNTFQFNQNDGIEFLGSTQAVIHGNLFSANVGRGIDILVRGGQSNYEIGDGTEAGRNRILGNQREGIYFVSTASSSQNQNVEATVPLAADGAVGAGGSAILQADTNTITNNGIGSSFSATGLVIRQGSTQGNSGNYFSNETGTAVGYGSPDDINPNSRTNARIEDNTFDGNFGDDARFETFVSTVVPLTTGEPTDTLDVAWNDTTFFLPQSEYHSDPLARLNVVFEGNEGNGLNAQAGGGSYNNAEPVFKSRDTPDNENLTTTPDDSDGGAFPGPFPTGGTRGRSILRVPSRGTQNPGPFETLPDPPLNTNPAPDAVFTITNVQPVDIGNGVTELEVTLGLDFYGSYNGVVPFNDGDFIEIEGVNAVGGGVHTANGVYQVDIVDPGTNGVGGARIRLRNTTNENGPGYAGGGVLYFQLNTAATGFALTDSFYYPGTGASTLRIAQGFDTTGGSPSDQFTSGSNFSPAIWGGWAPNLERTGSVGNVVADPANPFTRMLVTAPNHQLGNNRIVEITGVEGIPSANGQFQIRVVDANTFSIPTGINGTYQSGGSWVTLDESFPEPNVPTFPLSDVIDVTPDPRGTDTGVVTLEFTEDVTGVDIDDLFLTRDGVPVDISSIFVQQISPSQYQVDLSSVTAIEGQYSLTIDTERPEASFVRVSPDPRLTAVDNLTLNFTENVTGVDIFDFTLLQDIGDGSGPQPVDLSEIGNNLAVTQVTPSQYTLDLSTVTAAEGSYQLILNAPRTIGISTINVNMAGEVDISAPGHALATGQTITIAGVRGATLGTATNVNGTFRVIVDDDDSFRLSNDGTLTTALAADDSSYNANGSLFSFDSGIIDEVGRVYSLTALGADASASVDWVRGSESPTVDIIDVDPDPRSSAINEVTFVFSEPVVVGQVDVTDFTLTRNTGGGPVPVSLSGATVTALDDPGNGLATTFVLGNIAALTSPDGDYRLTLISTGPTRIQDGQGNFLVFPAIDDWTMINDEPAADILDVFPDPRTTAVGTVQFQFNNGDVTGVDLASAATHFTLTRDAGDGNGPVDVSLTGLPITQNTPSSYSLDLTSVTSDMSGPIDGTYTLTLNPGTGITRVATGAPLTVVTSDSWVQDTTGPTAEILDISPDPRIQHAGVVTIQFDEPVQGVDAFNAATDFTLTRDIGDGSGPQPVSLVGTRVRAIGAVDSSGNPALPFSGGTIFSDTYVLDLSAAGLTDIDGTYTLTLVDTGAISDATGNAYVSTPDATDTWILIPKQVNDTIEDVVFANNPVTQDSFDLFFTDTTAPFVVPGTVNVDPDPRSTALGIATVNFSEAVTGVNLTDFVLTRDAVNVPLTGLTVTQVTPSQYTIDLNLVTGAAGSYVLGIQGTNSLIMDLAGNPIQTGLITLDSWMVQSIGPTATVSIATPRMNPANDLTISFTKPVEVAQLDLTDLRLERDTGSGFVPVAISGGTITPGGAGTFEDTFTVDLSADTGGEGLYRVTLIASNSGIVDQAGIELGADAQTTFSVDTTAPTVDIIDIAPDPRNSAVGLVNVLFDEDVTGLDLADAETDFNLLFDDGMGGGPIAVSLSGLPVVQETARRYTIDLSTLTMAPGDYELQIVSNTGIQDAAGNSLEDAMLGTPDLGALDAWFNGADIVNPTVDIVDVVTPRNNSAGVVTVNFSEDVTGVDIGDFTLTRDTGSGPMAVPLADVDVSNAPGSASQYLIDLTDASFGEGTYTLSVVTTDPSTPITDASGNALLVGDSNVWVNTLIDPSATIVPVSPTPRLRDAGVVTIDFSEDVVGVDVNDFRLTRDTGSGPLPVSLRGVSLTASPPGTDPALGADQFLLDLSGVTGIDGTYRLTLVADGSGIENLAGDDLTSDAFDEWETATTISVNTFSDTVDVAPGDGIVADSMGMVSLRAAIMEAGALAGDDTIVLSAGNYGLSIGGAGEDFAASGDLDIFDTTGSLTIIGAGADLTTIDGNALARIFHITSGATLILDGVTVTDGRVFGSEDGAGIRNDGGTVTIRNSVITANRSFDDGGGINNAGTMTLIDTTVSANVATNNGGGIRNVGNLTITNSTIGGVVDAVAGTDTRNLAGLNGGGIINLSGGVLTISNSTISGNEVNLGSGGGLRNSGTGSLTNVTIANNVAGQRGGGLSAAGSSITVQNTIIADNSAVSTGNDVSVPGVASALVSLGNNLVEDTTDSMGVFVAAGDITLIDPLLGALQDNGGATLTHALSLNSAAFDAGAATTAATDQRGIPRVLGNGSPDIGAFEYGGFFVNSTADTVDVNPGDGVVADDFGRVTLRAAIQEANALATSGQSVSNAIMLGSETYDLNLDASDTTGPTADVIDVTPDPLGAAMSMTDMIDEIVVDFNEPVLNVDLSDFRLTFDDGMSGATSVTLDTVGGVVLTPDPLDPMNPVRFTISGLQSSLAADGLYTLDVLVSDITDFAGNALEEDPAQAGLGIAASDQFTRGADVFAPTVILSQVAPATRTTNPGVVTFNFSENVFGVSTSAGAPNFTLTYDDGLGGGPIPVSLASAAVQQNSQSEYQLDLSTVLELNGLTDEGDYVLTFDGSTGIIQDVAGNRFLGMPGTSWTVVADTFAPTVTIEPISPDPRVNAVGIVTINFDEPVTGVDLASAETDFDLTLDVDGVGGMAPVAVDLSALTVTQVTDSQYTIDLTTFTVEDGDYVLSLVAADGMITDLATTPNALVTGSTDLWTIGEDAAAFGDLDVTSGTLSIFGVGTGSSIIDANDVDRVFDVSAGVTFNLADLTVTGGNVEGPKDGGGIRSNGTVSLTDAEVTDNEADGNGGGIFSNGTLTLTTSTISDNTGDFGGGVFNDDGTVTVTDSLLSTNTAMTDGGGFFNDRTATVNILGSTVNGNMAGRDGAGIYNNDSGTANITDSTVTRNTAVGDGGGLFSELAANSTLTNSTIAFNSAANGGGIFNQDGVVTVSLASISANQAANDGGGLFVTSNGVVNASGSTFSGNLSTFNGGGISNAGTVNLDTVRIVDNAAEGSGGGISNSRTLTLQSTDVTGNSAAINGGGIANRGIGNLTLTRSSVSANTADVNGGGLHLSGVSDLTATFSTIDSNTASGQGGGLFQSSAGTVAVTSSTVSRNTAASGGGIYSVEGFSFVNSTLSTNTATGNGGGLNNNDTTNNGLNVSLDSATVFGNAAGGTGGGVQNDSVFGPVNVRNTIIARNTATTDVDVSGVQIVSQGNNLIGDRGSVTAFVDGVGGNIVGTTGSEVDPLLGLLQNNGGATETHSLQFGSPARDGGSNVGVALTDQRGFARIFDGDGNGLATIDIGAFESGFVANTFADTIDVLPGDRSSADVDGSSSLRAAVMEANAQPGDDTILLIPGTYRLTIAGRDEDAAAKGDLDVTDDLTIIGAGVDQTFIDGGDLDRIFHVLPGAQLDLQNLTIRNGEAVIGGAILNGGSLNLENVIVESSTADIGGGLYNDLLVDTLAADILAADTTLVLSNASAFPADGPFDIRIGSEEIRVTTVVGNSFTVTRGVNGTTAADHFTGDLVTLVQELTITDSTIRNNTARLQGGGLFNENELTLTRATFTGNVSHVQGGGLFNQSTATIIDSTFDSNVADGNGGAIYNNSGLMSTSRVTITGSTLSNNEAATKGGGIYNNDIVTILNSTLSGNHADAIGGGIFNSNDTTPGSVTIANATIVENTTDGVGGGVVNDTGAFVDVQNSIIAANTALGANNDVQGQFVSLGTNFIGDAGNSTGFTNGLAGDQVGSTLSPFDAVFGPLADNGGPTLTHALLTGSPAINAGNNAGGDPVDQRGGRRPTDDTADIGAFEVQDNRLSIGDVTQVEGAGGSTSFVFTVLLEAATAEPISVDFTTVQDTARAGEDFLSASGTVNFAPGEQTQTIRIDVNGDTTPERPEQFFVQLSNAVNASIIQNERQFIALSGAPTGGQFTLAFNDPVSGIIGTSAAIDFDATATAIQAAIEAGIPELVGDIQVTGGPLADAVRIEFPGELAGTNVAEFTVGTNSLTGGTNPMVSITSLENAAIGTIQNDDAIITVAPASAAETDSGLTTLTFTVELQDALGLPTSSVNTITVDFATADGTAVNTGPNPDYVATSGTLTFNPGETSKTVAVSVIGDTMLEPDETVILNLTSPMDSEGNSVAVANASPTGSILNDETEINISNVTLAEGDSGTTNFDFLVTLTHPNANAVAVDATTVSGSAIAGSDFTANSQNLQFAPGETMKTFTVQVIGDSSFETDEQFTVQLSNPTEGVDPDPTAILNGPGTGTILNDEAPPDEILIIRNGTTIEVYVNDNAMMNPPAQTGNLTDELIVLGSNTNDDVFTIDFSGGDPIPTNNLTLDGQGEIGGDSIVIVNGSATDIVYTATGATSGSISIDGSLINYDDFEPITDSLTADTRTFEITHAGGHTIRLTDDTSMAGHSLIDSNGMGQFESVSFANPAVSLTVTGSADADAFIVETLDAGFAVPDGSFVINTGNGANTLDASTSTQNLVINGGMDGDTLTGGLGNDTIDGGAGADDISGGSGADNLTGGADSFNDTIDGGAGDDVIDGGMGDDSITGGADNDNITAGDGNDIVDGGSGEDTISGGAGNDNLSGGSDSDTITGESGDDVIMGDAGTDDLDGGDDDDVVDGGDDADVVHGGTGNDMVSGGGGADMVFGDAGDDSLAGGSGVDQLDGGADTDSLSEVATGTENIILNDTTITVGASTDNHTNIEQFNLTGGELSGLLDASAFNLGNVTLNGAGGNDTLVGSPGNDSLIGGADDDLLQGGEGNDDLLGSGGNDVLQGQGGNDNLIGNSGNDQIDGGTGADFADGGAGNDTINGGAENDVLNGGDNNDVINGDDGDDQLFGDNGEDTMNGGTGDDVLFGRSGNDSLQGGDGDDLLVGDDGDDMLDGQANDDTVLGGSGTDTMFGGLGADFLDGQGSSLDEIILNGTTLADTYTLTPFGSFVNLTQTSGTVYSVMFRRTEKINLNTLDGDDSITTGDVSAIGRADFLVDLGAGNDTVDLTGSNSSQFVLFANGQAGMDTITGGDGTDVISGGDDDDFLDGANGDDTMDGGNGEDFLLGNRGNDNVDAGAGNDRIIGAAGADVLNGGDGDDCIRGNGGFDTIFGGAGNDSLFGDGSADTIFGGDGHDKIAGRAGNDDLFGEGGNDTIIGEAGQDFIDGGENVDIVAGGRDNDALVGSFGNDILLGQEDNDTLYGGAGRDQLFGMQGADFLKGQGTVRDTLVGGTGNNDEDPGDTYNASETNEIDNNFMLDATILTLLNF